MLYTSMRKYIRTIFRRGSTNKFLEFAAPGHYYSPIPDLNYILKHQDELFTQDRASIPGIKVNSDQQSKLISEFSAYYEQLPFAEEKRENLRYYFNNPYFCHGSAVMLYSIMRYYRPKKIVEVGSGFSSAAMLDINDLFFDSHLMFTFIEPYPERLFSLMNNNDKAKYQVIVSNLQDILSENFNQLEANDILFIDSSHVVKIGSDVSFLFSEVLPILKPGVIIHIHDIFWPFEYPKEWFLSGISWNEAYMLKAFLQFNDSFEILLFNSYLAIHERELLIRNLPLFMTDPGSSIWIRKIG